ncbi:MAG: type IV toxin-antitoxin system AbiEi family antitoxin domain-containing protein [Propionibacteriaceae bacterium]|jgi:predicted transcriptional regulator of viral defense system|nr:type IV toxin-antitoxin system AbiEi family antitoxin domain-containing protein [Propionibacteriaceae bacterium]
MKSMDALRELGALTASQWGMVTTAQATARGISRLQLSRLTEDGQLERVGHGIYRDTGAPLERFDGIKAAWLSVNPKLTAQERMQPMSADAVVSGPAASHLLNLGDLVPEPYQFTVPTRRQTQRNSLTFRVRKLPPSSVIIREGLPITTPEQTIADLINERQDLSLVADVFADADSLDSDGLVELLHPLAARNGFKRGDGAALYAELERLAHRDADSLARAVSNTALAAKIAQEYLRSVDLPALSALRESMQTLSKAFASDSVTAHINDSLKPSLEAFARAVSQLAPAASMTSQMKDSMESLARAMQRIQPVDPRIGQQLADAAARMRPALEAGTIRNSRTEDEGREDPPDTGVRSDQGVGGAVVEGEDQRP